MTRILISALLVLFALAMSLDLRAVAATQPEATATPEPVEDCPMWKMAGLVPVYRCEDDYNGVVCYIPVAGVMQCVLP